MTWVNAAASWLGKPAAMAATMFARSSFSLPLDGVCWSWCELAPAAVPALLPFVLAVDPGGAEARHWERDAQAWLGSGETGRGIVAAQSPAGVTLALFFHHCGWASASARLLLVERLRWLELTRPHRTLDALLAIVACAAARHACCELLVRPCACAGQAARRALESRAAAAGLATGPDGWRRVLG